MDFMIFVILSLLAYLSFYFAIAPDVLPASFQKQYIGYLNLLGILVLPFAHKRVAIISILFLLGAILAYFYIKARRSHNWVIYLGSAVFNYGLFLLLWGLIYLR